MKQFKILLVRYLLFFYLTSSYLSATHVHSDALASHNDCKVCIVVKNLNSGDVTIYQLDNPTCDGCYEPIVFQIERTPKRILKGFNANAPPLF